MPAQCHRSAAREELVGFLQLAHETEHPRHTATMQVRARHVPSLMAGLAVVLAASVVPVLIIECQAPYPQT